LTQEATGYWRSVATVFSGTVAAQMIPLLGSLVIARLYIPAEFGVFMAWLGMASVVGVVVTCRFDMALALEPDGEPRATAAMATLVTMLMAAAAVSLLALPVAWLLLDRMAALPPALVALFPAAFLALAAWHIWHAWAAAEGLFGALSMMRIVQAAAITGLQIAAGLLAPSAASLAAAHIVGVAAGIAMMMIYLPPRRLPPGWPGIIRRFWSRYRKFLIFALPGGTINTVAAQLPVLIVTARFGAEPAGLVALAFRTLGAPIALLGTAVLDVFKRRASSAWRLKGECRTEYLQTFRVLAFGSVAASVVFFVAGEELFAIAFGEEWRGAGRAAVLLLPLFALRFVASPLSFMFFLAEKQQVDLVWQVSLLAVTAASLSLPATFPQALLAYAAGYSLLYLVYLALSYRFSLGEGR
jgi:O-antigen/teichoic acid export membrane protein